jgi:protein-disulfide isomerase
LLQMAGLLLALLAPSAYAGTPACEEVPDERKAFAAKLLASQRPYECCDDTIASCLEKTPTCSLAFRLSENICRRVTGGQSRDRIVAALSRRALNVSARGKKSEISLMGLSVAGDARAPITLVEYACPRCPYCAKMTPEIHDAVVKGPLEGKVKLFLKTFPLRSHSGAKESGLAFVAAQKLGHFWEFVLYFYQRSEFFSVLGQVDWAEAVGMDRGAFRRAMDDPASRRWLVETKKEGIVNNVEATPTFFVNGRKYQAELIPEELIDVLEEEFDRIKGIQYRQ